MVMQTPASGGGLVEAGGTVANTTAVNSQVTTFGNNANAGIGGGLVEAGGTVAKTTAVNSWVKTRGGHAFVGIGGGVVQAGGTVANTTAVNSWVKTCGDHALADIGGGIVEAGGTVANTTAVNCMVNGQLKNHGNISVHQLSTLCQKTGPRVLTANCSSRTEFLDTLYFSYSDVCPVNAAKVSTTATATSVSTAATSSTAAAVGILLGSLMAAGGLGIVGYSSYQWITGYREGLRGQELAMKPLASGRELASAAVNWVSQGVKVTRERMNSHAETSP
ncbi:hypothetical protein [Endozoicomonas sp. ONNA2]|uniref:hypothetical protein n=1 Tax=Endozoicomonas sp. ONNA2 TaxID=2828741 RepID=UPI002147FE55|nr:hypothetical protein [Endozoicomonas sp. ONNA2]